MASIETTSLLEEKTTGVPAPTDAAKQDEWRPSAIAADIATLGTGTLLAGLFNAALVFVVPKLTSVEDYGYWRLFGLYAGYVGFLHFGFADGALLRWAGRPFEEFRHELGPAVKYLLLQQMLLLVPACAIAWLTLSGPMRFVGISVAVYALVYNMTATLQYGLQAAKIFRPVAVSSAAAPALFLVFVLLWHAKWQSNFKEVTGFYVVGWLVMMVFLLARTKPWIAKSNENRTAGLVRDCLRSGWPIVMANTGVLMIAYADRLVVSWSARIQDFAQYSLAGSAMAVPVMTIQACSKVFFSHLAGVSAEGQKRIYGMSSRMLLIAWAALLPYYFALEVFIRHFLPRYVPSLQYARILLLGIPFLAAIQILQMSYAYLNGMQKRFLVRTATMLAVSIGVTSFAAFRTDSLRVVAVTQVVILGAWWFFNEWTLRGWTHQSVGAWTRFGTPYLLVSGGYWLTTGQETNIGGAIGMYYLIVALIVSLSCRNECKVLLTELVGKS